MTSSVSSRRCPLKRTSTSVPRWPPLGVVETSLGETARPIPAHESKATEARSFFISPQKSGATLRQQLFHHFAILDDFDRTIPGRDEVLLPIDPHLMIKRRRQVRHGERTFVGFAAGRVGGAVNDAPL